MNIVELERSLRDAAPRVPYPPTPDIRAAVVKRVRRAPDPVPIVTRSRLRLALAAACVAVSATVATVGLSPSARRAVADWLGVDGVRISFDNVPLEGLEDELNLGRRVSFKEAQEVVDFEIAVPAVLGEPDAVFVRRDVEGGEVSLVWEQEPGLPASEHTDAGAILTQFRGSPDPVSFKKVSVESDVTYLMIDGRNAFFLDGAPHLVVRAPSGARRELPPRFAGNTLLWDGGAVTYRLEADVTLARAREIASSID